MKTIPNWKIWPGVCCLGLALSLILWPNRSVHAQSPDDANDVAAALANHDTARVVVALQSSDSAATVGLQVARIQQIQQAVLAELSDEDFTLIHQYETLPALAGEVTAAGLEALLERPEVVAVALDQPVEAALAQSVVLIGADRVVSQLGFSGAGVNVAVIDTGVDPGHPDLADNVVAQKCFNRGMCPPANTDESDNALDQNGHGTHVAGIITGRGEIGSPGVAPDAGLVAIRVLGPTGNGFTSDVLAGIEWAIVNRAEYDLKVINLSLGSGAYSGVCDDTDANNRLYAQIIQQATEAGITIFAASGNRALTDQIMSPACISGVVAVGGTYDANLGAFSLSGICTDNVATADKVACFSNSSSELDLLAPGSSIQSAALNGGQSTRSGTSMSTAFAAGVAALMLQADPGLAAPEIETILAETGKTIVDPRNGRITPRVDAFAAVSNVMGNEGVISGTVRLQGRQDYSGTDIFLSEAPCPATPTGAPAATTGPAGGFELSPAPGQIFQCLQARHAGYLIGQQSSPAGELGVLTLPGGDVTGDNKIDIFDISFIAARFGSTNPAADITGDGQVDIFDLVITAANYGRRGPITDWR
jgi:subtilisin family serine protease